MNKRIRLFILLFVPVLSTIVLLIYVNRQIKLVINSENEIGLFLKAEEKTEQISLWHDESEDIYYFFLPAFVKSHRLYLENEGSWNLTINGENIKWYNSFNWQENIIYEVLLSERNGMESQLYHIVFMKSQNLPAVFIETESGSMEYVDADKENEETGLISVIKADGSADYCGKLDKISGRGNSTWNANKKPYAITLKDAIPLCGMSQSRKWKLMALAKEGSKMNNMLVYDMAEAMGMTYTTDAVWVDLYLNGKYNGIYMLNESISVGEGSINIHDLEKDNESLNPDIESAEIYEEEDKKGYHITSPDNVSGGYLLEVDNFYYYKDNNYFKTEYGHCFVVHEPQHTSIEELEYISQYVQSIEAMIFDGNEEYRNYIDMDSIVQKFLIDEISLNVDAGYSSVYYYKNSDDDLIYGGPVWDYDMSLGEANMVFQDSRGPYCTDYEATTLSYAHSMSWQTILYEDSLFQEKMISCYKDLLPYMEEMLERGIDEYAEWIRASVNMDSVRWKKTPTDYQGHYTTWENDVRYIKFFLAKRLNYLNALWGVPYEEFKVPTNGEMHEVTFMKDNKVVEVRQVMDGDTITAPPELDEEKYIEWRYMIAVEPFREKIPVYEDVVVFAEPIPEQ